MKTSINQLYNNTIKSGQIVTIQGWVKSNRSSSKVGFLDVNDGSTLKTLQVVYLLENLDWKKISEITTGSAVGVTGEIVVSSKAHQPFELKLHSLDFLNLAAKDYPIQKKTHNFEFLRTQAHLRTRTDTFLAVFKIRNKVSFSIHSFFQKLGFIYLNSPIITANDAEGAGENFIVTTIPNDSYEKDFFGKKASLTVSGQLNAEAFAQAFKKVYTFGPTFRAENSNTTRHAAEFWMVEPEVSFSCLEENIKLARDLVVHVVRDILSDCKDELDFFDRKLKSDMSVDLLSNLKLLANEKSYKVITYTRVIELLIEAKTKGKQFNFSDIEWGIDLQSEHERYICEEVFKGPVFVTDYPQKIKAFYMKLNPIDKNYPKQKTVAAMDLLVPKIGELIGGSVREDSYQKLLDIKEQLNLNSSDLQWYFDLRKSGFAPSAGFGLGLERLIMLVTGINNIRDVIPFPRTSNNLFF